MGFGAPGHQRSTLIHQFGGRQVEEGGRVGGVVIHLQPQQVAPLAFGNRAGGEHHHGAAVHVVLQADTGFGRALGHANHPGVRSAVQEELLHCVAERAVIAETAELPFEISEVENLNALVSRTALGVADEGGYGRGHPGDGSHAAWNLFDVNPRIGRCDRHNNPPRGCIRSLGNRIDIHSPALCRPTTTRHRGYRAGASALKRN